jgi:hypothetical protein
MGARTLAGMAVRSWARILAVTVGAGVLAGAGQLGIGYGLGILRWDQQFTGQAPWHALLTWVAFIAASSVVAAAIAGSWISRRQHQPLDIWLRLGLAAAGALGSALLLPLVIRPAGLARLPESGDPRVLAGVSAGAGLLVGIVAAVAVLSVPAVRGNVVTCVLWLWLAAFISAAWTLTRGAAWATARLGLLPAGGAWIPIVLLGVPVLIALLVAAVARFGGSDPRATAGSGLAGPLLVGAAYLIAGPGGGVQTEAYRWSLGGVGAAFAVSVLVAVARKPRPRAVPAAGPVPDPADMPGFPAPIIPGLAVPTSPAPTSPAPTSPAPTIAANPLSPISPAAPTDTTAEPGRGKAPSSKAPSSKAPSSKAPSSKAPTDTAPTDEPGSSEKPEPTGKLAAIAAAGGAARGVAGLFRRAAKPAGDTATTEPTPATPSVPAIPKSTPSTQDTPTTQRSPKSARGGAAPAQAGKPAADAGREGQTASQPIIGDTPADGASTAKQAKPVRGGWRARRKGEAEPAELPDHEADYVDWVKGLGAAPAVRVGGDDPGRHSKAGEQPKPTS